MYKYILTKDTIQGTITYGFSAEHLLIHYSAEGDITPDQLRWLLPRTPFTPQHLTRLAEQLGARLNEIPMEVSWEAFYDPYPHHRNKHRAIPIWQKLSPPDQARAIMSIPAYRRYLEATGYAPKLPENYLRDREFENDWHALLRELTSRKK